MKLSLFGWKYEGWEQVMTICHYKRELGKPGFCFLSKPELVPVLKENFQTNSSM